MKTIKELYSLQEVKKQVRCIPLLIIYNSNILAKIYNVAIVFILLLLLIFFYEKRWGVRNDEEWGGERAVKKRNGAISSHPQVRSQ